MQEKPLVLWHFTRPGKIGPGPINPPEPEGKILVWVRDFQTRQKMGQPEPDPFKNGLGRVDPRVMWADPFCRFFFFFLFFLLRFSASTLQQGSNSATALCLHHSNNSATALCLHHSSNSATALCLHHSSNIVL